MKVPTVFAGQDLIVTCAEPDAGGFCQISPSNTPLFNETHLLPGDTVDQNLTVTNHGSQPCTVLATITEQTPTPTPGTLNLKEKMYASIQAGVTQYFGTQNGNKAGSTHTYADLFTQSTLNLGLLFPDSTQTYSWRATLEPNINNEYQRARTVFDLSVAVTCDPSFTVTPTTTQSTTSTVLGTSVSAPQCTDSKPGLITNLNVTYPTANTAQLTWTNPAEPFTGIALIFTQQPNGPAYGSTTIGKVNSYQISNLPGGQNFTFELFAINGCAPGERAIATPGIVVPGGETTGRPLGPGGQVLGLSTELTPEPLSGSINGGSTSDGEVAGAFTCTDWQYYLPWILLVAQALLIIPNYLLQSNPELKRKQFITTVITGLSLLLFYSFRSCDCYAAPTLLGWLCRWYWLAAIVLTLSLQFINYMLIEKEG